MPIKKFTANSYARALNLVKKELGEHALILNTRTLSPAEQMLTDNPQARVEITAAVDFSSDAIQNSAPLDTQEEFNQETPIQDSALKEEEGELKSLILSLLTLTEKGRSMDLKTGQMDLFQKLSDNGVNEKLLIKLFERLNSDTQGEVHGAPGKPEVSQIMQRMLPVSGTITLEPGATKKVALVGPTGMGKTTTIAKLAALFALKQKKKVALVTLDTYRIAAVDQLKVYGNIMGLPVEVADNPDDFQTIIANHADKDLVLIDTVGKSHTDLGYGQTLKSYFGRVGEVETHLLLSVAAQEALFTATLKQFDVLKIDRLLFSKLDEGIHFGALFNFSLRTRIPMSYFTTGQRVPQDIESADANKVIRLIFN